MSFEKHVTSDGWTYGKGEYEKKISQYLGFKAPSLSSIVTVPASITGALSAGVTTAVKIAGTSLAKIAYGKIAHITIPTYYIYAISPSGVKTVAEWPIAELTRDTAYNWWRSIFIGTPAAGKQVQINHLKSKPPIRSMSAIMNAMKGEVDLYFDAKRREIRRDVTGEVSSTFIALAAATALGLFIAFS